MKLWKDHSITDGAKWVCDDAHFVKKSIRRGSWFTHANLNLMEALTLSYMWVHQQAQTEAQHEAHFGHGATTRWYRRHRDACLEWLLTRRDRIGGPGQIVEIDESKFGKRKYHRGHRVDGSWVFGGIERHGQQRAFFFIVEKRDTATLLPLIKQYIVPGSIIISDCWKAYNCLKKAGYRHYTVNHSKNFKDPITLAHTNTIEGSWLHTKRSLPKYGVKKKFLAGYLASFLWKREVRRQKRDPFEEWMKLIRVQGAVSSIEDVWHDHDYCTSFPEDHDYCVKYPWDHDYCIFLDRRDCTHPRDHLHDHDYCMKYT